MVELEDLMNALIGDPYIVFAIHRQPMGHIEETIAPGSQDLATLAIEAKNGPSTTVENENVIVRSHGHTRHLSQSEAIGKPGPPP